MAKAKQGQKITGVDAAVVFVQEVNYRTGNPVRRAVPVMRGEELPPNLVKGEEERLADIGAFEGQTRRQQVIAARQARRKGQALVPPLPGQQATTNRPETPDMGAPGGGDQVAIVTGVRANEVVDEELRREAQTPIHHYEGTEQSQQGDGAKDEGGKAKKKS